MTASAVRIRGLSFQYDGAPPCLSKISFDLAEGDKAALLGPSGAGKSTLLLHLNGLLPTNLSSKTNRPSGDATKVEVFGVPVESGRLWEVRRLVGLLFQNPDDQLFCETLGKDVAFGPSQLGLSDQEAARRASSAIAAVGLATLEDRSPEALSLGERKRACLAGVLACDPKLLALDEPTASLDPRSRRAVVDLLIARPETMLIATHDLALAEEACPRSIVLDDGIVCFDGSTADLLADQALLRRHGLLA